LVEGFRIRNTLKWKKYKLQKKREKERLKAGGASPKKNEDKDETLRKSSIEIDESFEQVISFI
jgi:hypothetical protein